VGEPVVLELESGDVIHSFWVPNLSGKKDMIPGRTNLMRIQADEPGRYGGVCTEFCGGPHALMGFVAVAHEPGEWEQWAASRLEREQAEPEPPGFEEPDTVIPETDATPLPTLYTDVDLPRETELRGDPAQGRELFMASGCGACHRVAGTEANGLAGPDLTHLASRLTLGAGILPNHRGTLMGWIADSQSIKPGNRMPTYDRLSAEELNHIAAWLERPQ
jgi:cytochrome c oxidase subunit 2